MLLVDYEIYRDELLEEFVKEAGPIKNFLKRRKWKSVTRKGKKRAGKEGQKSYSERIRKEKDRSPEFEEAYEGLKKHKQKRRIHKAIGATALGTAGGLYGAKKTKEFIEKDVAPYIHEKSRPTELYRNYPQIYRG